MPKRLNAFSKILARPQRFARLFNNPWAKESALLQCNRETRTNSVLQVQIIITQNSCRVLAWSIDDHSVAEIRELKSTIGCPRGCWRLRIFDLDPDSRRSRAIKRIELL